jgi:hypothetical protein
MYEDGRNHHSHRAKCIGKNMQENAMHVLIAMSMVMSVIMTMMVVSVLEAENADQVDKQASYTNGKQFTDTVHLAS